MKSSITEECDGVQLTKYYDETEFERPSIVYEFESLRVEPVTIHLTEKLPDDIEPTDIGFHMVLGSEHWQILGRDIQFEYELDGDAEYRTVYAVKPDASGDATDLMTPPDELTVDPPAKMVRGGSSTEVIPESSGFTSEEAMNGEPSPSLGHSETNSAERKHEENDSESPTKVDVPEIKDSEPTNTAPSSDDEPLLDQLAAELKAGHVSDGTIQYLREEIGNQHHSRSVNVRIKQLQTDLADLRAYTNTLETFLDEYGSAEEVIERFEKQMDSFETDLAALETSAEKHTTNIKSHDQEIQDLQEEIESVAADFTSVKEEVAKVSSEVEQVADDLEQYDIDSRFEDVESQLSEIARLRENLKDVFEPKNE